MNAGFPAHGLIWHLLLLLGDEEGLREECQSQEVFQVVDVQQHSELFLHMVFNAWHATHSDDLVLQSTGNGILNFTSSIGLKRAEKPLRHILPVNIDKLLILYS